ncbi:2-amino-4-hydroxy-6-hydroxymethyldihydropteridine diphosphokinase [Selenomonadales bacterium OttesenSCG-928-I06]|nr:2-amino-4-hydroxy-6-hydroxymethyldihydropteridine diphosphokinase [Selenomonadales bacterium OttesenSCG-928-I06]
MIILGLGSNIEEKDKTRYQNIVEALNLLAENENISIEKVSSFYETEPIGFLDQPDFLNIVIQISTNLAPLDLLNVCADIEKKMKRAKTIKFGPRNIDIDVILYNDVSLITDKLIIPHPRFQERKFVLVPMLEILGDINIQGKTIKQLILDSNDNTKIKKVSPKESNIKDLLSNLKGKRDV